ncbi:hypothetical protein F2P81_007016 [Scophthalmus maximus]|uniref:non-specific serine/threonine protein kinase n=1 Tax=Scophthalmus maximus TaxID=52904 RepID=A0A6A4T9Q2_SCOMX|nr:hypothetical protein F2P81_007016 [Scophthalmus maximus]
MHVYDRRLQRFFPHRLYLQGKIDNISMWTMTSRRPMTRTYSANGRTSSFSEEEGNGSNGRSESRSSYLSNVRPENRSTLCSVMAQLTEDIQPSFETTLKSKAVSENCNVKFTCVVSGYPAPELKWYKDDMEMDRYCGLPKYEIRRNGKNHTLHIYNCTLEDAAIYQASASNSKGIVSCSGVLEVGTMSEYKIHQQFFAKLKQKAEKKKKEQEEQTKKKDKENIQTEKPQNSPEPPPRKRHIQPTQDKPVVKEPDAGEQLPAAAEPNGVTTEVTAPGASIDSSQEEETTLSVDTLANKKMKISNGVDAGLNSSSSNNSDKSHMMGNGGENCYDGGISLAQFLAETLQTQAAEEKQNPSRVEKPKDIPRSDSKEKELTQIERGEQGKAPEEEYEREKRKEEDLAIERENERERPLEMLHTTGHSKHGSEGKHHSKAHKDHDHHNIQTSISSMLHTVKDFFFGKSKKDFHENMEKEFDHDSIQHFQPETPPPSSRLRPGPDLDVSKPLTEDVVPMETTGNPQETSESANMVQQSVSLEKHEHKKEDSFLQMDPPPGHKLPPEPTEESTGQRVKEADEPAEAMEVSVGVGSISPSEEMPLSEPHILTEMEHKDSQAALPQTTAPYEEEFTPTSTITSLEESWIPPRSAISESDSHKHRQAPTETLHEQLSVDKMDEGGKPYTEEGRASTSLEERIEPCEYKTPDQGIEVAGFPPTPAQESSEKVDPKIQHESAPVVEGSAEVHNLSAVQSSDFRSSEERSDMKEVLNSALEKDLAVNLCNNVNTQEPTILESENTEARCERLQIELETDKRAGELNESTILSVTQKVTEEHTETTRQDDGERQLGWPSGNIPQIQISTVEDTPHIKPPTVPDVNPNFHFVIPKIEIMEPEVMECAILDLNKSESESGIMQKHYATHKSKVIIQDMSMTDSSGLPPTQKAMQNDHNLCPTERVKEVAQLYDVTKIFEQEQPHEKSSQQLPQMDCASSPVLNVSCSDDRESGAFVNAHVSHTPEPLEARTVPLFVVPPISVTCHESDPGLELPTHSVGAETETSDATQRGAKHDVDNNVCTKPEKNQSRRENLEEVAEKSIKENTPSLPCEALVPRAGDNVPSSNKTTEDNIVPEIFKVKPLKEAKLENFVSVEDLQRGRPSVDRLSSKPPAHPSLSPASLRKFMSRAAPDSDNETGTVPVITVGNGQSDKVDEDLSGGSTPTSSLSCESSPRLKRRDSLTLIRSATPEELASGARRKIFIPKPKEDGDGTVAGVLDAQGKKESPYMSPSQARRAALLQAPKGQNTPPMERRSPLLNRRKAILEVPKVVEDAPKEEPVTKREEKPAEKKLDPLKAPQVIRKIRGEPFPDASGHLKLWCQFFNVLSDSTIKWYRDEEEILEVKRSGSDESQVALAIVLASSQDCGVFGCTINNEYGSDTTDFLLSEDILSEILLREDLEVGEEIEMMPLLFTKGLVDGGSWGDKYFGRIMTEAAHIGEGCAHKASRVKVIYGLDPVYDSGSKCIIKVKNPIAYGTKQESNLAERNQEITKQECKVQNMIREYCKIFAAEARVNEGFGFTLELITRTVSEVEMKCSSFQHWIHQWTHGNLLVTRLEGVETKLTNVRVVTKSKSYQGLTEEGSPEVLEQFLTQHQCNYYCGLLGLRPLKSMDSLQQPTKVKGSRSPLLNRKLGSGSPQLQRKGHSPQMSRKANSSPKVTRKVQETEDNKSDDKPKPAETGDALEKR